MSSFNSALPSPILLPGHPRVHKRSISITSIIATVLPPVYNQQNEDACIIRTSVEDDRGNLYKSIIVCAAIGEGGAVYYLVVLNQFKFCT